MRNVNMEITIEARPSGWNRVRFAVGSRVVRFGAWIMGIGNVDVKNVHPPRDRRDGGMRAQGVIRV